MSFGHFADERDVNMDLLGWGLDPFDCAPSAPYGYLDDDEIITVPKLCLVCGQRWDARGIVEEIREDCPFCTSLETETRYEDLRDDEDTFFAAILAEQARDLGLSPRVKPFSGRPPSRPLTLHQLAKARRLAATAD